MAQRILLQYSLRSTLSTITVACLLLAYLRPFGTDCVERCAVVMMLGAAIGLSVGAVSRRTADVVFWSMTGAALGYLAVLNAYVYHWSEIHVWPMVGALSGAMAAMVDPSKPFSRMIAGMLTAATLVAVYLAAAFGLQSSFSAELLCAVLGGAVLGLGAALVTWIEEQVSVPRSALAIGLTAAAISGHWIATSSVANW